MRDRTLAAEWAETPLARPRALVAACLNKRFVGLARARLGRDVGAQIADNVAALIDVGGGPATALAVEKMRAAAL